jgi:protein-L-isoaspartate(D-aspartate) O-methyltransferase
VSDFASQRATMVERQLRHRGIHDERVLAAMGEVPREAFLPVDLRGRAYEDSALPIYGRQTISQPWIVAAIAQAMRLQGGEQVLEIGTGTGYSTCVLSLLAAEVISLERLERLSSSAGETLSALRVENVELIVGDGSRGLSERAPFDAIAVHAAAPGPPPALLDQLGDRGRLVVPVVQEAEELLIGYRRSGARLETEVIGPCRFVPLIGEQGY